MNHLGDADAEMGKAGGGAGGKPGRRGQSQGGEDVLCKGWDSRLVSFF